MLALSSVSKEEHKVIGVQSLVTKVKEHKIYGRKNVYSFQHVSCVYIYSQFYHNIFHFKYKKEDLVGFVRSVKLSWWGGLSFSTRRSHREKSLLISLRGSQSGTTKTHCHDSVREAECFVSCERWIFFPLLRFNECSAWRYTDITGREESVGCCLCGADFNTGLEVCKLGLDWYRLLAPHAAHFGLKQTKSDMFANILT